MSQENMEVTRSITEAFQRRDREANERSLDAFDPDVEWTPRGWLLSSRTSPASFEVTTASGPSGEDG